MKTYSRQYSRHPMAHMRFCTSHLVCSSQPTLLVSATKGFWLYFGHFIRLYLDNFCVYGTRNNHVNQPYNQLRLVFEILTIYTYFLSMKKCCFDFEKEALLEQIVLWDLGDPNKASTILALSSPVKTTMNFTWNNLSIISNFTVNDDLEVKFSIIIHNNYT